MGQLRDRVADDLPLAVRSEAPCNRHLGCAAGLVKHFMRPPEQMGETDA